jgi:hypothetical protein
MVAAGHQEQNVLQFEALGRLRGVLHVGGIRHVLAPRQTEVVTLLALRPGGWTAGRLAEELFGDGGNPVSVRALMSRLRAVLGERLHGQPYRIAAPVWTDFGQVEERLNEGRLAEALDGFAAGELLPAADSPMIAEARLRLTMSLREAVMASHDATMLALWLSLAPGEDDVPACRALIRLSTVADPRHSMAAARLRRLSLAI